MTPNLDNLIHLSETGFMKNRNISHNIRQLIDIMNIADDQNLEALIISLDFEKAFDRVEKTAIHGALNSMNFEAKFIEMIDLLCTNLESCTINAWHTSHWFKPTRSLQQGYLVSSAIFICVIEIL